jgi:hypothetical protein
MRSRKTIRHSEHSLVEQLESRQLFATIGWDGGGDGTSLNDPVNWAGDVLPGTADDALIDTPASPTISLSSGTFAVHSLTCTEAFNMSGGTLNVASASTFSGAMAMTGGIIVGLGAIAIDGPFAWDAGTLTGAGSTTIGSASIVTMNTGGTRMLSRTLTNNGRINHSAGLLQFTGSGTLNNAAGHIYNLTASATMAASGSNNTINNAGVINDQTSSTISLNLVFNNSGQLNVYGGVLNLDGGGTNSGTRNLASGAVLNYRAGYTHAGGSNVAGSGTMNFVGGTQIISGNWTSNARLQLLGGTLDGSGNLTTNGPLIWGGGTMTGSGNITIMPSGKLALTTGAAHTLSRDIVNNGNLHFLNGVLTMAGALITNAATGTFAALPTATIASSGGINVIDNDGLFKKMGPGTLTFDSALGGVRMNNTGTVDVRNGVLNLNGPVSQLVTDALNGGTWQLYPTATLSLGPPTSTPSATPPSSTSWAAAPCSSTSRRSTPTTAPSTSPSAASTSSTPPAAPSPTTAPSISRTTAGSASTATSSRPPRDASTSISSPPPATAASSPSAGPRLSPGPPRSNSSPATPRPHRSPSTSSAPPAPAPAPSVRRSHPHSPAAPPPLPISPTAPTSSSPEASLSDLVNTDRCVSRDRCFSFCR